MELSPETKKAQLGLGWMDLLKLQDDETDGGCSEIIQGLTPNNSISLYGIRYRLKIIINPIKQSVYRMECDSYYM